MAGTARPVREGAYTGGSRMAVPYPGTTEGTGRAPAKTTPVKRSPAKTTPAKRAGPEQPTQELPRVDAQPDDQADEQEGTQQGEPAGGGAETSPASSPGWVSTVLAPPGRQDLSGFLLGLLVWGWVVLPFLRGGTTGVKDVWRAKWLNKGPSGQWLP